MRIPLLLALAVLPRVVAAQCPDGTPPPCAGRSPVREVARIDPNLVAVLPFRVTTSDTLLGEGFAELLATQFTGEGSPRAVDMATVLSAWRAAGGGLRSPLPRTRAVQLGRDLGAGLVSEGSIVGLGGRVTVSASLVSVPGGEVRGSLEPVTGPVDSLDHLLGRVASGLLAAGGRQPGSGERVRFSESPTAMRAYLEGLSFWRRGRLDDAAAAFDRAIAEDSGFAQARFRRYTAANWGIAGTLGAAAYARLAWDRRAALSQRERAILETLLGTHYPASRLLEEKVESRRLLATQYPDSPDAWYFLGDYYFHFGRVFEPTRYMRDAMIYLERSAAIDSQATAINHLVWGGIALRDTALLRRAWPALDRTDDQSKWMAGWLAAATIGDAALLGALRRRGVDYPETGSTVAAFVAASSVIPPRLLDEMFDRWAGAVTDQTRRARLGVFRGLALRSVGRPLAAESVWSGLPQPLVFAADEVRLISELNGDAIGLDVAGALQRSDSSGPSGATSKRACLAELVRRSRGDSARVSSEQFRATQPHCARMLDAASYGNSRAPDAEAQLAVVDSSIRNFLSTATSEPYDGAVLSVAWERRGALRRALAASRYNINPDFALRREGRLAAMAGDTAGAVFAFRRFLDLTAEGEAVLAPVRDSVRAELARLERR